jgi:hypothetical protein
MLLITSVEASLWTSKWVLDTSALFDDNHSCYSFRTTGKSIYIRMEEKNDILHVEYNLVNLNTNNCSNSMFQVASLDEFWYHMHKTELMLTLCSMDWKVYKNDETSLKVFSTKNTGMIIRACIRQKGNSTCVFVKKEQPYIGYKAWDEFTFTNMADFFYRLLTLG